MLGRLANGSARQRRRRDRGNAMAMVHDTRASRAPNPISSVLCAATTLGGLILLAVVLSWLI